MHIHFDPVSERNLADFVRITRDTLWQPVYPGDDWLARDFARWHPALQQSALLIFADRELVGRVVAPQFDDYQVWRELGLRADPHLIALTAHALLERAARQHAHIIRAIVLEPYWSAFERVGLREQKRRVTMQRALVHAPAVGADVVRPLADADADPVGELMHAAYIGTVDDEGEGVEQWRAHTRDVMAGQYGQFLSCCSFVTPTRAPFHSGVLVIENAPQSALIAQVVTRHAQTNRGHARRLLARSLAALGARDYRQCFLEVTTSNANALHLYRKLDFTEIGPQIVYGIKHNH